ncbi:MAG: HNH endonuclease [Acidimicrobiia bacterium]|nr:HNH endonuclease [Acidimicrobiia bacterium]
MRGHERVAQRNPDAEQIDRHDADIVLRGLGMASVLDAPEYLALTDLRVRHSVIHTDRAGPAAGANAVVPPTSAPTTLPRMERALVLNASYEPLSVVSGRRAVILVLGDKADLVRATGHELHSERLVVALPSVIRLRYYVRVPYRRGIALSRRGVFARDGHRCQYCGSQADSLDHVVPRSRGRRAAPGRTSRPAAGRATPRSATGSSSTPPCSSGDARRPRATSPGSPRTSDASPTSGPSS